MQCNQLIKETFCLDTNSRCHTWRYIVLQLSVYFTISEYFTRRKSYHHVVLLYVVIPVVHVTTLWLYKASANYTHPRSFSSNSRPRWLIRSDWGLWRGGTRFEFRSSRIFVILVVDIQCSKLFKSLVFTVLPMLLCTIRTLDVIRNKSRV